MKAININWDIDADCSEDLDLPTEMHIPNEVIREQEENEDAISDWISDQTGFCHYGFELVDDGEEMTEDKTAVTVNAANRKIVRVNIVDNDEGYGCLAHLYIVDPDLAKLAKLRDLVYNRFDNDGDACNEFEDISKIEEYLQTNFEVIEIDDFEIEW